MAGELIWSRAALDDLDAIATFIARDSVIHARFVVEKIIARAERLLAQPPGHLTPDAQQKPLADSLYGVRLLWERQGADLHLLAIIPHHHAPLLATAATPSNPPAAKRVASVSDHNNPWLATSEHEPAPEPSESMDALAEEPALEPAHESMSELAHELETEPVSNLDSQWLATSEQEPTQDPIEPTDELAGEPALESLQVHDPVGELAHELEMEAASNHDNPWPTASEPEPPPASIESMRDPVEDSVLEPLHAYKPPSQSVSEHINPWLASSEPDTDLSSHLNDEQDGRA